MRVPQQIDVPEIHHGLETKQFAMRKAQNDLVACPGASVIVELISKVDQIGT